MTQDQKPVKTLPLMLLVSGRPCLVVGGGTVAARKVDHLLAAGARVTVVSPEIGSAHKTLAAAGTITFHRRPFRPQDVDGQLLVWAATDNPAVNRAVGAACRERGILWGCVDGGWRAGDFISPAVTRLDGDVTIAVTTGGRSCTRARDIKNRLARTIQAAATKEDDAGAKR
jgi:siroheme synthase-like protein